MTTAILTDFCTDIYVYDGSIKPVTLVPGRGYLKVAFQAKNLRDSAAKILKFFGYRLKFGIFSSQITQKTVLEIIRRIIQLSKIE